MQIFRLFWLRETGCDAGTPLRADQLEPQLQSLELQKKIVELAGGASGEMTLRLPYLERREWRKRGEILSALRWQRQGHVISPVLPPAAALRNTAANFVLGDPLWIEQPPGSDPRHFAVWRDASDDPSAPLPGMDLRRVFSRPRPIGGPAGRPGCRVLHDRVSCSPSVSRPFPGPFTYDLRDYPECRHTLALATKMTGRSIQTVLASLEDRLKTAGMPELARRYAPVWYQDVVLAVRKKPKAFIALLTAESVFIDSPGGA